MVRAGKNKETPSAVANPAGLYQNIEIMKKANCIFEEQPFHYELRRSS